MLSPLPSLLTALTLPQPEVAAWQRESGASGADFAALMQQQADRQAALLALDKGSAQVSVGKPLPAPRQPPPSGASPRPLNEPNQAQRSEAAASAAPPDERVAGADQAPAAADSAAKRPADGQVSAQMQRTRSAPGGPRAADSTAPAAERTEPGADEGSADSESNSTASSTSTAQWARHRLVGQGGLASPGAVAAADGATQADRLGSDASTGSTAADLGEAGSATLGPIAADLLLAASQTTTAPATTVVNTDADATTTTPTDANATPLAAPQAQTRMVQGGRTVHGGQPAPAGNTTAVADTGPDTGTKPDSSTEHSAERSVQRSIGDGTNSDTTSRADRRTATSASMRSRTDRAAGASATRQPAVAAPTTAVADPGSNQIGSTAATSPTEAGNQPLTAAPTQPAAAPPLPQMPRTPAAIAAAASADPVQVGASALRNRGTAAGRNAAAPALTPEVAAAAAVADGATTTAATTAATTAGVAATGQADTSADNRNPTMAAAADPAATLPSAMAMRTANAAASTNAVSSPTAAAANPSAEPAANAGRFSTAAVGPSGASGASGATGQQGGRVAGSVNGQTGQTDQNRVDGPSSSDSSVAAAGAAARAGSTPLADAAATAGTLTDIARSPATPANNGQLAAERAGAVERSGQAGATTLATHNSAPGQADPVLSMQALQTTGQTTANTAAAPHTDGRVAVPLDNPGFGAALGTQVSVLIRDGVQTARLQLNPAEMGPITVQIVLDGSAARVDFQADLAGTRAVIEDSLPALAGALQDAGFTLAGGGVFQQTPGRQGQSQGEAAPQPGQPGQSDGTGAAANLRMPAAAPLRTQRGLVDLVA